MLLKSRLDLARPLVRAPFLQHISPFPHTHLANLLRVPTTSILPLSTLLDLLLANMTRYYLLRRFWALDWVFQTEAVLQVSTLLSAIPPF